MSVKDLMREPLKGFQIYTAGGMMVKPGPGIIKLNANENQMGSSPKALEAMEKELSKCNLYPMESITNLKQKIAEHVGMPVSCITAFNGSGAGIQAVAEAFLNPDDELLICSPTYMQYYRLPAQFGAKLVEVFGKDGVSTDLDALSAAITDKTKLIYICNPNNPTGTLLCPDKLSTFIDDLPDHVVCVIDEAYIDWVADDSYPSMVSKVLCGKNVIVLRTFSKIYGLAGIRCGYAVASEEIITCLSAISGIFGTNRVAAAGAAAALEDKEFYKAAQDNNTEQRAYLSKELEKLGCTVVPSSTSFIYFAPHCDTKECMSYLESKGVYIRYFSEEYIRVSIGLPMQNQKFLDTIGEFIEKSCVKEKAV
ncbi:histidinol-phosphate transaminase [Butyrivibrio fibrisolvens]|uniref:Histidinol-phosphate transaminase n=2 Tax=Butyrivibrio fibrisolvens TaxID=831 RepID=A0A317G4Q4_BUTFI|nr:histidinol-phosphate transaminase [Butyrivibrio fibrisolvens]PWT27312.1 histidinol-phosphate transaminase [Butyrivibrio fibrisolvens]SHI27955.1 histidinol-phosphate aminotransferase [Butyrivibrio fibrisolvens DSM 3071]